MPVPESKQFDKTTDHGRIAFKVYMAVYRNHGDHVILAAPTIAALSEFWEFMVPATPLQKDEVQEILIVKAAPPSSLSAAEEEK